MFDRTGGVGTAWWKPLEFYYPGQAIGLWMPWSLLMIFLPVWFWRTRRAGQRLELDATSLAHFDGARFLGWCALVPCLALSFSAGRKGYYLLPTFPIWSLLLAWAGVSAFQHAGEHARSARRMLRVLQAHAVMFTAVANKGVSDGLNFAKQKSFAGVRLGFRFCVCYTRCITICIDTGRDKMVASHRRQLIANTSKLAWARPTIRSRKHGANGRWDRPRLSNAG